MEVAEERKMDDESDGNFCIYCMIDDCVLHSGFNMSEMIKFGASIEELEPNPHKGSQCCMCVLCLFWPPWSIPDLYYGVLAGASVNEPGSCRRREILADHENSPLPGPVRQTSSFSLGSDTGRTGDPAPGVPAPPVPSSRPLPNHPPRDPHTGSKVPKLKKLLLEGIAMSRIHIVGSNFPVLEDLYIGHPTRDYDFDDFPVHLDVPTLRTIHFRYFSAGEDFAPSLSRSPKLESFRSYKFDFDTVTFVLPSCRILSFYRSDSLSILSQFAPKLERLIQRLDFLDQIPGIVAPLSAVVMNCGYGNIPDGSWRTSGRCTVVKEDWSQEFINW